jgi:tetratricopeptide (TPR) repeat protein
MKTLLMMTLLLSPLVSPMAQEELPSPSASMREAVEKRGVDGAVDLFHELQRTHAADYDFSLEPIVNTAVDAFKAGQRQSGIDLMEAAKRLFPEQVLVYSVLGQLYWYAEDRERCIENFRKTLSMDPDNKTASRYWDLLFFVPDDFEIPDLLLTRHLRIRPLHAEDVDLDYRAVMSSVDHLKDVFGPGSNWPTEELTREDDLRALKKHEKEHLQRAAFTYTVMNHDETDCLGCVYILPAHAKDYDAQVYLWVTAKAFRDGRDAELYAAVRDWIEKQWPFSRVAYPGRGIDWESWEKLDE